MDVDPYKLLLKGLALVPISHYLFSFFILSLTFLYHFLEFHFFQDLLSGFRGSPVTLIHNPSSPIYNAVVSKCQILHGRYLPTPWLSSPHFQTFFLSFFGRPPAISYHRRLFYAPDGGTIALDWLLSSVSGQYYHTNDFICKDDNTPIVIVLPGLTSDSASAYIKHIAFCIAKHGWNVVVSNHRGLGGVSVTSDCFYNAGWTEDIRVVVNYLHHEYPKAPLFAVGTSIGANILVKYLGENEENTPIAGAAAICSPWDLLIGDRFISRTFVQKFYDKALTIGLQSYARLHEPQYSRLANWEGIKKSRSIRDFDNHATCHVGNFETVDTYYRRCSSAGYVGRVAVPLLCISALDDPLCTREAIPWDECRANRNIVLATTKHGGHLAFFEGISASGLWPLIRLLKENLEARNSPIFWWHQNLPSTQLLMAIVNRNFTIKNINIQGFNYLLQVLPWVRAVEEFLGVLHSGVHMHVQKIPNSGCLVSSNSTIDQGPYVNVAGDGRVTVMGSEQSKEDAGSEPLELRESHCDRAWWNIF